MFHRLTITALTACLLLAPVFHNPARAAEPVAIVEQAADTKPNIQAMEYLYAGQAIDLGSQGRLVVGYFRSCMQETIVGGRVTIGKNQSALEGGSVERETVNCDGGHLVLAPNLASESAALVLRNPETIRSEQRVIPTLKVFATSPAFTGVDLNLLLDIERLDTAEEPVSLTAPQGFVDLATKKITLTAGGIYRATAGSYSVIFSIDALAGNGRSPLVGRIVPLQP